MKLTTKLLLIILLALVSLGAFSEKQAMAHSSLEKYKNFDKDVDPSNWKNLVENCITSALFPTEFSSLLNVYIPPVLYKGMSTPELENKSWIPAAIVGKYAALYTMTQVPTGWAAAVVLFGIDAVITIDICTNSYVLQPHEHMNQIARLESWGKDTRGKEKNLHPQALTKADIPYYYHCDPGYIPGQRHGVKSGPYKNEQRIGTEDKKYGHTWGYMDMNSEYCNWSNMGAQDYEAMQNMIGKVKFKLNGEVIGEQSNTLSAGEMSDTGMFYSYYKLDGASVKQCVATPFTLVPIEIGCIGIAPPGEVHDVLPIDSGTICGYFTSGRQDLISVGKTLPSNNSVAKFLKSDWHFISTSVGCIKDTLVNVFNPTERTTIVQQQRPVEKTITIIGSCLTVTDPVTGAIVSQTCNPNREQKYTAMETVNVPVTTYDKSTFMRLQEGLRQTALAGIALSLMLLGYKLLIDGKAPEKKTLVMYAIKVALVLYIGFGDFWYRSENGGPGQVFAAVLSLPEEIADMFLQANDRSDALGQCSYKIGNSNVLSNRQLTGYTNTLGRNFTQLTVWDYLDCKLVNYFNLGTCQYTFGGFIMAWLVNFMLAFTGTGLLIAGIMLMYCVLMLMTFIKFIVVFVMSICLVTVLIFLSPIFITLSLFEYTQGMFKTWSETILKQALYAGLIFAMGALFFASMDHVLYGDINPDGATIQQKCVKEGKLVDSLFCKIVGNTRIDVTAMGDGTIEKGEGITGNLCNSTVGIFLSGLIQFNKERFTGDRGVFDDEYGQELFKILFKVSILCFLFYIFFKSMEQFMEYMMGVSGYGFTDQGNAAMEATEMATKAAIEAASNAATDHTGGAKTLGKAAASGAEQGMNRAESTAGGGPTDNSGAQSSRNNESAGSGAGRGSGNNGTGGGGGGS
jgi:type IV secretion system protein VirB6